MTVALELPKKVFVTPRLARSDAYTVSGFKFESPVAIQNSMYYGTFRRFPHEKLSFIPRGDNRIVFGGLQRIVDRLLRDPITHEEIDETKEFLKGRKAGTKGMSDFEFPEKLFRKCVDEYNGRLPIEITGFPEGSIIYPHEPFIRVANTVEGFGPLASWFESPLLRCWATTARLTAARHWLEYNRNMIRTVDPTLTEDMVNFFASLMMHDFGARASSCEQEAEDLGLAHLYCFGGTDTFEGAYQAWKNGAPNAIGSSVWALAHRIVQGFEVERECYEYQYDQAPHDSILSQVSDCYNFYRAVEHYILPLAKKSAKTLNGKILVVRPDSAKDDEEEIKQILWTLNLAKAHGLYEEKNGFIHMTTMRIILGDSMNFDKMQRINRILIENRFAPHGCLIYGVGGSLRNTISRDDYSGKYALCAYGKHFNTPCIKLSEVSGKSTLPNVTVLRTPDSLRTGVTLVDITEAKPENDAHAIYYNGLSDEVYGEGMNDTFIDIQDRVLNQFKTMPEKCGLVSKKVQDYVDEIRRANKNLV